MQKQITIAKGTVFPSDQPTIVVDQDQNYGDEKTGGAHRYTIVNSLGFADGQAKYDTSTQTIQFVQKDEQGLMIPGLQDEQLILMIMDRNIKMNAKYPHPTFEKKMAALQGVLDACQERVQERIDRGVMGELKK